MNEIQMFLSPGVIWRGADIQDILQMFKKKELQCIKKACWCAKVLYHCVKWFSYWRYAFVALWCDTILVWQSRVIPSVSTEIFTYLYWLIYFFPRSAYCGGLWLAALRVMSEIAMILGCPGDSKKYNNILQRGKKAYERKLWNGTVSVWNIALLAIIVWRRAIVVWRTEMKPRHPDR